MALKGTAVITGAATGIGQALAVEAAARGARVAAMSRDLNQPTHETLELVRAAGGEVDSFVCDITDDDALATVAKQVSERMDGVNYVLANAGLGIPGTIEAVTLEDFAQVVKVNLFGTLHTVRRFLPYLRDAAASGGEAAVMIMGSEHSLGVPPNQEISAYTIAKHALLGLADVLRKELDGSGISVTFVAPGWTLTEGVRSYVESDAQVAAAIAPIAQTPEKVASVAWDAIEAKSFLAPTNPHSLDIAMKRIDDLHAGFEAI
ncbi:SDR family NAD(P)-dependent oxidoreductase [Rhodococcus koreensis]